MPKTVLEFDRFICDKCKKEVTNDIELQETFSGKFVGGYTSVFGDMAKVEFDLCQECLKELIGGFCRINV
jgi:thioredoxin-related protein